ncbi:MAG: hypothetical protein WA440_03110 [Ignavibacteriaceae bacterium]
MLEGLAETIFKAAGFDVQRNVCVMGYEIDLLVKFGDRTLLIECKQYEKSYLPVKNLIFQWKGKNEVLNADRVILIIYGVDISDEENNLANECGIQILGIKELNEFLSIINDRERLCAEILKVVNLKERDIAETNEKIFKKLIWKTLLSGKSEISEDERFSVFRQALRYRIITNLKEFGSTPKLRENHIDFFENVIKETETKRKLLIFKVRSKLSERIIWDDIKNKIMQLKPFSNEIDSKYLGYMQRIEEGFQEYFDWFTYNKEEMHRKLITERLLGLESDKHAIFRTVQVQEFEAPRIKINHIIFNESAIGDIKILEWILTDLAYDFVDTINEKNNKIKELHWYPASLQETVEYTCRILYEYFGIKRSDKLLDKSLLTSDEFYNIKN